MALELRQKGVERDVIAAALSELNDGEQLEAARRIAARFTAGDTDVAARIAGRLQRRGFSAEIIRTVLQDRYRSEARSG
jgi:SOS response regulatory protein OraA/RecX